MEQSSYANTITSSSGLAGPQLVGAQLSFAVYPLVDGDAVPWYVWLQ